jgi:hypothetical protein
MVYGLSRYHIIIGGDGLWYVTVSHHDWWGWSVTVSHHDHIPDKIVQISGGGISTGVVGANRKTVCRRDPDWVTQIF